MLLAINPYRNYISFVLLLVFFFDAHAAERRSSEIQNNGSLSLQQAERLAIENDSLTKKFAAESIALQEKGIAASRLPDPKLKLGVMNMPTDTYDLNQEPMTQQVIGIQQMFPPFNMLDYKGEQLGYKGKSKAYHAENQKRITLRGVRTAWLNVYKQHHSANIINKSELLFEQVVKITKSQYRQGRGNQQIVIRAQLELSLLQDKKINIEAMRGKALADLGKWIGRANINRPLDLDALSIPELAGESILRRAVENHPTLKAAEEGINAAKSGIDVAKSRYKPAWMMDLTYGKRGITPAGVDRADFLSLMFMVDLPFFTSKRQDKWLIAGEKEYNVAQYIADERQKNLTSSLEKEYVSWKQLTERLQHYRGSVLPQASQNAEAALKAYKSQVTEFNPLMRARLMELKIKLQALYLLVDRAIAQVNLLYLTGDRN